MSVFANGREVSGKAQPNKVIAGFPSVCMSPPPPPAGPVPIPYPMFTDASKTTKGTTTVKIKGKEVGKKNASEYKSSQGNEPATRSFGMDVVSATLSGASKHEAYSFDVTAQGAGVERFMDLTTTNHSNPATAFQINTASLDVNVLLDHDDPCKELHDLNQKTRDKWRETDSPEYAKNVANANTTVTSALHIPAPGKGEPAFMQASSRQIMRQFDDSLAEGLTAEQREAQRNPTDPKKLDSNICNGHTYERGFYMPHSSHTEARLLEDIFKGEKKGSGQHMGKIILGIDWPGGPSKDLPTTAPCKECEKLLCAAAPCIDIVVCTDEGPVDYNKECAKKKKKMSTQ
jgi:Domain of unknown function (DUF4150)